MLKSSSSYWGTVSVSKYEDNSDAIPRLAVVLVACSKALAEVLLARKGEVEVLPEPIPTDELEAPGPLDAKI
jgi:hypothetical protein